MQSFKKLESDLRKVYGYDINPFPIKQIQQSVKLLTHFGQKLVGSPKLWMIMLIRKTFAIESIDEPESFFGQFEALALYKALIDLMKLKPKAQRVFAYNLRGWNKQAADHFIDISLQALRDPQVNSVRNCVYLRFSKSYEHLVGRTENNFVLNKLRCLMNVALTRLNYIAGCRYSLGNDLRQRIYSKMNGQSAERQICAELMELCFRKTNYTPNDLARIRVLIGRLILQNSQGQAQMDSDESFIYEADFKESTETQQKVIEVK